MNDLNNQRVELPNNATAWQPCMVAAESIGQGTNIGALSHIGSKVRIEEIVEFKEVYTSQMVA